MTDDCCAALVYRVGHNCSIQCSFKRGEPAGKRKLQREFPLYLVCSGLGNSPRIAQHSYLLVTEDDFAKAAGVKKVMVEGHASG